MLYIYKDYYATRRLRFVIGLDHVEVPWTGATSVKEMNQPDLSLSPCLDGLNPERRPIRISGAKVCANYTELLPLSGHLARRNKGSLVLLQDSRFITQPASSPEHVFLINLTLLYRIKEIIFNYSRGLHRAGFGCRKFCQNSVAKCQEVRIPPRRSNVDLRAWMNHCGFEFIVRLPRQTSTRTWNIIIQLSFWFKTL